MPGGTVMCSGSTRSVTSPGSTPGQAQARPELIGGEPGEAAAQAVELDVHALGLAAGDDEAGRHALRARWARSG